MRALSPAARRGRPARPDHRSGRSRARLSHFLPAAALLALLGLTACTAVVPSEEPPGAIENPAAPLMPVPLGDGPMSSLGTGTTCVAPATGAHWNPIRGKPTTGGVGAIRTRVKATFEGTDTLTRAGVCEIAKANVQAGTFGAAGRWCGAKGHTANWEATYAELDRLETCRATTTTVNTAPTVSGFPSYVTLTVGVAHQITLGTYFSDSDTLSYTATSGSSHVTVAVSGGTLTITASQATTTTVTVTASDGEAQVQASVTVSVTEPNTEIAFQKLTDCSALTVPPNVRNIFCDLKEGETARISSAGFTVQVDGTIIGVARSAGSGFTIRGDRSGRIDSSSQVFTVEVALPDNRVVSNARGRNHGMGSARAGGGDPWVLTSLGFRQADGYVPATVLVMWAENDKAVVDIGYRGQPSEQRSTYVRVSRFLAHRPSSRDRPDGTACWINVLTTSSSLGDFLSLSPQTGAGWVRGEMRNGQPTQIYCDLISEPQFNPGDWKVGADASFHAFHNVVLPFHRCPGGLSDPWSCDGGWLNGTFVAVIEENGSEVLVDNPGPARWRFLDGVTHEGTSSYRWRRKGVGSFQPSNNNREMFPCNGLTYEIAPPGAARTDRHFVSIEGGPPRPFWTVTTMDYSC